MVKTRRHHAHDRHTLPVELNGTSYDIWITAKASFPKSICEDDDVVIVGLELFRGEDSAVGGSNTKQRKKVIGGRDAEQALRHLSGLDEIATDIIVGRHL